jgi:hypothetical protein
MKLTEGQIGMMATRIVKHLVQADLIVTAEEENVIERIQKAIHGDLLLEDKLNEEVRELLMQYAEEMRKNDIQYHEMFKIIKAKLAKERKLIL